MGIYRRTSSTRLLVVWFVAALAAAISFTSAKSADVWSREMSVSFQMGEADSRLTALEGAREKLREKALSESGAYVESRQVLSEGQFKESLRLLRSAFVSISDETVRVRTNPENQVSTLYLDATAVVDTGVLRDRVKALAENTTFQQKMQSLSLEDRRIVESLDRLSSKLRKTGVEGALLADYKELLIKSKESTRLRVAELVPGQQASLLEQAQYGAGLFELGKLVALEKYYLDVVAPLAADLSLEAKIVSAAPSTKMQGATEVKVVMEAFYDPESPVAMKVNRLEHDLNDIVNGDFWLPSSPQEKLSDLKLAAYDQWVEATLLNMPLLAVVSLGDHKAYFPVLGNRISVSSKGEDQKWGHGLTYMPEVRLKSAFKFAPELTRRGYRDHRTITQSYTFQIPNADAAMISDVDVDLKLVQITPEGA